MRPTSSPRRAIARRWPRPTAPLVLFTCGYVGFLAVLWVPIAQLMPTTLRRLGLDEDLFGYLPPARTVLVYLGSLAFLWLGFLLVGRFTDRDRTPRDAASATPNRTLTKVLWGLFATSLVAFLAQVVLLKGIPLLDLNLRWQLNVKLVVGFSLGLIALCTLLALRGWRPDVLAATGVWLGAATLLGARSVPLIGVVAIVVVTAITATGRTFRRILIVGALLGVLLMVGVGAISKSQIYQADRGFDPALGIALVQSDAIGGFYNLDRVQQKVDDEGQLQRGRLLIDTTLNMIPGVQREYANYQIGTMLGGRQYVIVNGQRIARSVSLSATFIGAQYADGSWPGTLAFSGLLGALWAICHAAARAQRWFVGLYAVWVARLIGGIDLGIINEYFILTTALAVAGVVVVRVRQRRATPEPDRATEPDVGGTAPTTDQR